MKRTYLKPEAEVIKVDYHAPLLEESTPGGDDNFGKENDWDDDFNDGDGLDNDHWQRRWQRTRQNVWE